MPTRPLDEQKCPVDIQVSIGHIAVVLDMYVECRALIDSGAGSSYASAKLISLLKKRPVDVTKKRVDMLVGSQVAHLETYQASMGWVSGDFNMDGNLVKVNEEELLSIDNPRYDELIKKYPHLRGVEVVDHDLKPKLPIHVALSAGEYARVKTATKPQISQDGEPIAELTTLGWFVMSPGAEFDHNRMLLTQTFQTDYEQLWRLDVLGLKDTSENDQGYVYTEFKEQLKRDDHGWYESGLPWRANHPPLPNHEKGSLPRLDSLVRKLERTDKYEAYDQTCRANSRKASLNQHRRYFKARNSIYLINVLKGQMLSSLLW